SVGLDLVEPGHREFHAQGLAVVEQAGHGVGENLVDFRPIDIADRCGALLVLTRRGGTRRRYRCIVCHWPLLQIANRNADQSCSPKRDSMSAAKASMTSAASLPVASTVMVVPGDAASIIRPMIEVPPTTSLPRMTRTAASNFSTVCTKRAEARACRPFLLQMVSTRTTAPSRNGGVSPVLGSAPGADSFICR